MSTNKEVYNYFYTLGCKYAEESLSTGAELQDFLGKLTRESDSEQDSLDNSKGDSVLDFTGEKPSGASWGDKVELFTEGNSGVNVR